MNFFNFFNFFKKKSQAETEAIMEKLLNRMIAAPFLLEDEKLNAKIEKLFDNHTFQKMVENTDVFQDISNLSFTNSFLQKNKMNEKLLKQKGESSWEMESVPQFGRRIKIP